MDRITIIVRHEGSRESFEAAMHVPSAYIDTFQPLRTGDDRILGAINGEVTEKEATIIRWRRKEIAKEMAEELASHIENAMKQYDEHNGYRVY